MKPKASLHIEDYFALAACFLVLQPKADAEAIYTDIPDILLDIDSEHAYLDINDDGQYDYEFVKRAYSFIRYTYSSDYFNSHFSALSIDPEVAGNKVAARTEIWGSAESNVGTVVLPYALAEGININVLLNLNDDNFQRLAFRYRGEFSSYAIHGGNWFPDVLDHYIGIYFSDIDGCKHFGWIRCSIQNEGKELTIKDFAYETKCNTGLASGDTIGTPTTINQEAFLPNSYISILFSSNTISVDNSYLNLTGSVLVHDALGNTVLSTKLQGGLTLLHPNVSTGIYFIRIDTPKGVLTKKVMIVD